MLSFSWAQCSHLAHPAGENETVSGEVTSSALLANFLKSRAL